MKKLYLWLFIFFAIGQVIGQTTYYSKSVATNFNDVASWGDVADGSGASPGSISSADNFIIANGAILSLSGDATVRNLTINAGSLTVSANTLTVEIPAQKNASFTVNTGGAFIISGGNLNVNGNVYFADASSFTQSGGTITVDGNDAGNVATSVASTVDIFAIGRNSTNSFSGTLSLTGGTIVIVDPHTHTTATGTSNGGNSFYYYSNNQAATSPNHTLQFGNGISMDAGGNTAYGFSYNIWAGSGRLYAGNLIINTGTGVNRFVRPYWTGGVQEDLTITSGEFRMQTTFYVAGDVINNGLFSNSSTLYLGTFINATVGSSTVPQTISGSGEFRNVVTGTTTANMASLTINNTNASGVTLTGYSSIAAQPTNSFSFSGTLNLINGRVSMASSAICVVGIATPTAGTLNITNGGFVNGTTLARWWTNGGTGTATTAGTDPSTQAGRYPFLNSSNEYRNAFLLRTTPTAGGLIALTYNETAGTSSVSITDGAYTVNTRTNDSWTVSALSGTPAAAAHVFSIVAPNAFGFPIASPSNVRVVQAASVVGTHQLGTTTPGGQRAGLSFADLTSGAFHLGINSLEILSDTPDYVSLQWPPNATVANGTNVTVYGQVYEAGLTDVIPNITGQAPGIEMWVGISPLGQNTNPNTWTTWVPATWNSTHVSNNDEYEAQIGSNLIGGTYYYATRFRLNGGPFVYGGIDSLNNGNFWNGTTYSSGVLTVNPLSNDYCVGAIALTVGQNVTSNPLITSNVNSLNSGALPLPGCASYLGGDVWFSVVVPASGNVIIETNPEGSAVTDTGLAVYSGDCSNLVLVECDDDDSPTGNFSLISVTGRTPGEVLYIRAWEYGNNAFGTFRVSAYDCPSTIAAPTGDTAQVFCNAATVADLVATGTAIKWYASATGGTALLATDVLVDGQVYYASQTLACESFARLAVTVTINVTPAPTGAVAQDFCNETLADLTVTGTGIIWYDAATLGNVLPTTTVLVTGTTYYASQTLNGCESLTRLAVTVTENCPIIGCLTAPNGQWPGGTAGYTPTTCDGLIVNVVTTAGYAGEYSRINVVTGQTYTFTSSVATDFITISDITGTTAFAIGTASATWVSTLTGQIRFYTHLSTACGSDTVNRTRAIVCGVLSTDAPDYANLQFPSTINVVQGGSGIVYGQVYEAGLTDVVPNIVGQAPGIQAWVGISPIGQNTNPNTWTTWVPATWNAGFVGNNDEYQATIGATLLPGTYYYATRFRLNTGPYVYGGIDVSNNGNFWDGTTYLSGVLTVTPPPAPANDECSGALSVTVNPALTCTTVTAGTLIGATASTVDAAACGGTEDDDVWFSFVATATTHRVSLIDITGSTTDLYHSLWTGADCNSLSLVTGSCSDPNTSNPTGLTIGQTYYIRVYSWTATPGQTSVFNVCVGTLPPPPANDECAGAFSLTVNADYNCGIKTAGTIQSATASAVNATACSGTEDDDVWFSFVATATTHRVSLIDITGGTTDLYHSLWTGTDCNSLTLVTGSCSDPNVSNPTGLVIGQTYFVRVYSWTATSGQSSVFNVCIGTDPCIASVAAPTGDAAQAFCNAATVADLVATGTSIKWYSVPVGGTALLATEALVNGQMYYASQTIVCEGSARLAVTVTINTTASPTGAAAQDFCNETLADLTVTGTGIIWYDAATLGTVLPTTTVLVTGTTYYASQTLNGCESVTRLAVTVTENCPIIGCLTAPNGQWPGGTAGYTPTTCDGIVANVVTTVGYAGEYSRINVTTGQTYTFTSSVATDFITISDIGGTTAFAIGTGSATWVSTLTGQIRFYTHLDVACGAAAVDRTRAIICGIPSTDAPDYVSLQWPPTINVVQGGSGTVYGQVYEAGLTDVVPNIVGQAPGIQAWVGISPVGQNTNPNTWTTWVPATWNSGSVGNNDEYEAIIGATLAPGTYYYATRFRLNAGPYVYGGIDASNNGNFWNGTTHLSGVLTVIPPPPPANDLCADAIPLTVGTNFAANATAGTIFAATTTPALLPSCQTNAGYEVWYTVTVPASGNLTIETQQVTTNSMTDSVVTVYAGTCGTLTQVGCDDDAGLGNMSLVNLTGLTPGAVLYVAVWKWSTTAPTATTGAFQVSAYDVDLSAPEFDASNFKYYPNPVTDILTISYSNTISTVEVFNMIGQELINKKLNASTGQIDMSQLPSGTYVIKVSSEEASKVIKVIKN